MSFRMSKVMMSIFALIAAVAIFLAGRESCEFSKSKARPREFRRSLKIGNDGIELEMGGIAKALEEARLATSGDAKKFADTMKQAGKELREAAKFFRKEVRDEVEKEMRELKKELEKELSDLKEE